MPIRSAPWAKPVLDPALSSVCDWGAWPRVPVTGDDASPPGPRHELFVYVDDVDARLRGLHEAGVEVLREPADMLWGERIAYLRDPQGNVTLATAAH